MNPPSPLLGDLSAADFLQQYWQKKPLLIRAAWPGWHSPIDANELAGLAMEPEVESRLVQQIDGDWDVQHGPFDEATLSNLPHSHWTLLVQGVNHHLPEMAELLDRFRFIPNWRLDDVMVSAAAPDGGVGPHTDSYDVFLLQGAGRRRWSIGAKGCHTLIDDLPLQVIDGFEATESWVLEPGDMLYLPPNLPHHGEALAGDELCMTYSIGFRAPGHQELMARCYAAMVEQADPTARYGDPELTPPTQPGHIPPDSLAKIRQIVRQALADDASIDRWFAGAMTEPGLDVAAPDPTPPWAGVIAALQEGLPLQRSGWSRWAYTRESNHADLFVNGKRHADLPKAFAELLTGTAPLDAATLAPHLSSPACQAVLQHLLASRALVWPDDQE